MSGQKWYREKGEHTQGVMVLAGAMPLIVLGAFIIFIVLVVTCFKRHFSRIKDRSKRDPHVPGQEAKKSLRREIERRLERVSEIYSEPNLLTSEMDNKVGFELPPYYYRMKAVDNMKHLERELYVLDNTVTRNPRENVRAFLMCQTIPGGLLSSVEQRVIHELCDYYDHARHHPTPFGPCQYRPYNNLVLRLLSSARNGEKGKGRTSYGGTGKAPSDHDSAIDEPDQDPTDSMHSDEENTVIRNATMTVIHRPASLKVS
ncbi:protein C1orf43 homolog isoform X2 [Oratosquilla oratoria]|uniref:protein C1orf43 homolog isoform X2 n=1 Tax=Oratosquilla oratoria TaxID=337810 RepID=UPI003F76C951